MGLGESEQQAHLDLPFEQASAACVDAGSACGRVLEARPKLGSLVVRTRYGLQVVRPRFAITPRDGGSTVPVGSASVDVWGGGGREGADKFLNALETRIGVIGVARKAVIRRKGLGMARYLKIIQRGDPDRFRQACEIRLDLLDDQGNQLMLSHGAG